MATFFVNVNSVYSVQVDDNFLAEHVGQIDAIADEIASSYFAGDCECLDESFVDFAASSDGEIGESSSF